MLDKIVYITVGEKTYPITFTMNVLELMQDTYGSLIKWQNSLLVDGEPRVKPLVWSFCEMINEGIEIENEEKHTNEPKITHKQAGRIITHIGLVPAYRKIKEIVTNAVPIKEEDSPNTKANTTQ